MPVQYATVAHLMTRFDVRELGDLVNDDNTQTASGSLAANTTLIAMLQDASAEIRAAATARGAYIDAHLDELATDEDALLVRMTCVLAMGYLYDRRGKGRPEEFADTIDTVRDQLERLQTGEAVFGIVEAVEAGKVEPYRPSEAEARALWPFSNSPLFPRQHRPPDIGS